MGDGAWFRNVIIDYPWIIDVGAKHLHTYDACSQLTARKCFAPTMAWHNLVQQ